MRDTSLDDFAGDDEPTEATGSEDTPIDDIEEAEAVDAAAEDGGVETGEDDAGTDADTDDDTGSEADATDGDAPTPAVSTYDWTPSGADCASCGTVVEKRWRNGDEGDGALVCADCKEW